MARAVDHVSIADVGYVSEVFNVPLPWDDQSNRTAGRYKPREFHRSSRVHSSLHGLQLRSMPMLADAQTSLTKKAPNIGGTCFHWVNIVEDHRSQFDPVYFPLAMCTRHN